MSKRTEIYNYVKGKLIILENASPERCGASLARLRRGIGKPPGSLPELWEWTFDGLPDDLTSKTSAPTSAEWAIHISMSLYSFHQQGRTITVENMYKENISLGKAVSLLAGNQQEEKERFQSKLEMLIKADSIEMISALLRQIISQLRRKGIPLDYPALAVDIFDLQYDDSRDKVILKWGRDYYSENRKDIQEKGEE